MSSSRGDELLAALRREFPDHVIEAQPWTSSFYPSEVRFSVDGLRLRVGGEAFITAIESGVADSFDGVLAVRKVQIAHCIEVMERRRARSEQYRLKREARERSRTFEREAWVSMTRAQDERDD